MCLGTSVWVVGCLNAYARSCVSKWVHVCAYDMYIVVYT